MRRFVVCRALSIVAVLCVLLAGCATTTRRDAVEGATLVVHHARSILTSLSLPALEAVDGDLQFARNSL